MKESAIQIMFFCKDESQERNLHRFLKKYPGEMLITVPVNPKVRVKK